MHQNNDHIDISPVGDETLTALLSRRAREAPNLAYCVFKDDTITLGQLNKRVNQLAHSLSARGLRAGDRVALMLPSHPDHIVAIFALSKLGLIRVPVNVHLVGASLSHLFDHLQPHALIADNAYAEQLVDHIPALKTMLWRDATFGALHEFSSEDPVGQSFPDDILALTPSSGTTGAPKGVLKSDRTLRAGPLAILRLTGAQPGDTFLLWESLHHGAGVAVIISAVLGGIKLAMVERFSASQFWNDVRHHGVTHIHYLGSVIPMLLKQPPRPDDHDHTVRIAWGGGCPPELWQTFSERFNVEMREGYGLSELITFVTINPDGPAGAIGKPLDYFDVMLTDAEGNPVPQGEKGEITIRSKVPGLSFIGYFENPQAEASVRRGEWFCTGDLGKEDEHGFLYYAGRKKDMLRRRGINISAWEVERVVEEHPDIEETALIAVPSDLGEDELKLFIRVRAGTVLSPLALVAWCETKLPYFQIPRYIEHIENFPKTPTQRIRKNDLSKATDLAWDLETSGYKLGKRKPVVHDVA